MKTYKIAVIAGDGVGQEVIPEGKRVLDHVSAKHGARFEYTDYPWGTDYYLQHGAMCPAGFIEQLREFDRRARRGHSGTRAVSAEEAQRRVVRDRRRARVPGDLPPLARAL